MGKLKKLDNWRENLDKLIDAKENQKFEYGKNDCSTFGADIVLAQTGIDLAKDFRGKYKTEIGGLRVIRKAGYESQFDFIRKNFEEIPIAFVRVGDLGVIADKSIAVIAGHFAFGISQEGLVRFELKEISKAYRV